MTPVRSTPLQLAALMCSVLIAACGSGKESAETSENDVTISKQMSYVVMADFVNEADSLPRLKYRHDGQVTLNDRCPVRRVRLNPKMTPAYVNGHPVGFC